MRTNLYWLTLAVLCAGRSGVWSYFWINSASIVYSDGPQYGIEHGSEAKRWIVEVSRKLIWTTSLPWCLVVLLSLMGWAHALVMLRPKEKHHLG